MYVPMSQEHCAASVVNKPTRPIPSSAPQLDNTFSKIITANSDTDIKSDDTKNPHANLGSKRSLSHRRSLFSVHSITKEGNNRAESRNSRTHPELFFASGPQIQDGYHDEDYDAVSFSDFPAPPNHYMRQPEPSVFRPISDYDNTVHEHHEHVETVIENMQPHTGAERVNKSFAIRSVDLMIAQNPGLQSELNVLKKTIREYERQVSSSKEVVENEMYQQLWDSRLKGEKLEKAIREKETMLGAAYDRLDNCDVDLDRLEAELREDKTTIRKLNHDLSERDRAIDSQRRDHSAVIIRLEREKRALIEKMKIMAEQVETEKRKAESNDYAKEVAEKYNDGADKHYAFYRNYFNQQCGLYHTYFSRFGKDEGSIPKEGLGAGGLMRLHALCEERDREDTGRNEIIRNATEALRTKYRSALEANDNENAKKHLRGAEFLAWLDNGFDSDGNLISSPVRSNLMAQSPSAASIPEDKNELANYEDDDEGYYI